jgi:hypothetical protein
METCVVLFLCTAEFSGHSETPYTQAPETGSEHNCILFLAQPDETPDWDTARERLAKHGWVNAHIKRAGPFQLESVNSQQWQVFQRNYEDCLQHGESVVWYA